MPQSSKHYWNMPAPYGILTSQQNNLICWNHCRKCTEGHFQWYQLPYVSHTVWNGYSTQLQGWVAEAKPQPNLLRSKNCKLQI